MNDLIEEIVYLIFEGKVDLDDPTETIEQIKEKIGLN